MSIPDNLLYTNEHEWVLIKGDEATIGITFYAQEQLGDIVFVEYPEVGSEVTADEPFGVVESVKTVSDLFAPLSGEVIKVNEALESSPELVNSDPYSEGWIIKIKLTNKEEKKNLLSSEEYSELLEEEK
jgi:glycine cleavage system H protein